MGKESITSLMSFISKETLSTTISSRVPTETLKKTAYIRGNLNKIFTMEKDNTPNQQIIILTQGLGKKESNMEEVRKKGAKLFILVNSIIT